MDAEHFVRITRPYEKLLYHVSYTMLGRNQDCADAVQEALLAAWRGRDSLREEALVRPWLVRILINTCTSMLRRPRPIPMAELPAMPAPQADNLPLHDALSRLDSDLRLPLVLHYFEGFSIQEIAGMLGKKEGTVKTRMARGRACLETMLSDREVAK